MSAYSPTLPLPRSRFSIEPATEADDAALRRLLAENEMEGEIAVSFRREPSYFLATSVQGAFCQVYAARESRSGEIVGVATRTVRPGYLNGGEASVGYLADLRIAPTARSTRLFYEAYRRLAQLHEDGRARLYFTVVAEGNRRALRNVLRGTKGMPPYRDLGRLLSPGVNLRRRKPEVKAACEIVRGTPELLRQIVDCLNRNMRRRQFAPAFREEQFRGTSAHPRTVSARRNDEAAPSPSTVTARRNDEAAPSPEAVDRSHSATAARPPHHAVRDAREHSVEGRFPTEGIATAQGGLCGEALLPGPLDEPGLCGVGSDVHGCDAEGIATARHAAASTTGRAAPRDDSLPFTAEKTGPPVLVGARDDAESGAPSLRGFSVEDFYVAVRDHRVVGVLGKWDQGAYKQTVVTGYHGKMRWLRPVVNALAPVIGCARFPAPGEPIRSFYTAFPAVDDDELPVFRALLRRLYNDHTGSEYAYFLVGLHERDPLAAALRDYAVTPFAGRLFCVHFPDGEEAFAALDGRVPYVELAAL